MSSGVVYVSLSENGSRREGQQKVEGVVQKVFPRIGQDSQRSLLGTVECRSLS